MECRLRTLQVIQHLLVELLSRSQTRIFDLHVLSTTKLYHTLGKFGNLHRLSHVKHEDLTAITLRTCLQYQLTSLRYQHEETYDTLICDRHRTTVTDLLLKQRNHRTIRA